MSPREKVTGAGMHLTVTTNASHGLLHISRRVKPLRLKNKETTALLSRRGGTHAFLTTRRFVWQEPTPYFPSATPLLACPVFFYIRNHLIIHDALHTGKARKNHVLGGYKDITK